MSKKTGGGMSPTSKDNERQTCGSHMMRRSIRVVDHIARQRKWTRSFTLDHLICSSPEFKKAEKELMGNGQP